MSGDPVLDGGVVTIESGVSLFDGKPFCAVLVDGRRLGQLRPDEVREMAMNWMAAAEAAESDAIVVQLMRELGVPDDAVGDLLMDLRGRRVAFGGEG